MTPVRELIRSAITGRFVRRSTARRHPDATLVESTGPELRLKALVAAADAVIDTVPKSIEWAGDRDAVSVNAGTLRRLEAAADAARTDR
jgi:hypothetical protein